MKYAEPIRRTLDSRFRFKCHRNIGCFNSCCKSDILLTPYDVLRIKNRLGISSGEFLSKYTSIHIDKSSSLLYAVIRNGKCPFVTPEGCSIYEDRPVACRYYPVGQGLVVAGGEEKKIDEFYFFIKDPNCLGYQEDKEWTIKEWRIDQGADLYDEMNREWKMIQLGKRQSLDSKKQSLIYMISYDIDNFRRFVFESGFLDIVDLDSDEIERIKNDEVALMKFGFEYLKYILMLENNLKIKNSAKFKRS
jgi:hypothetical protein